MRGKISIYGKDFSIASDVICQCYLIYDILRISILASFHPSNFSQSSRTGTSSSFFFFFVATPFVLVLPPLLAAALNASYVFDVSTLGVMNLLHGATELDSFGFFCCCCLVLSR